MIPGFHGFAATLRRVGTDSGALLLMVGAIGLYSLFYPLPYLEQVVRETPVGVVDLDRSSLSRQLGRWVDAHEAVRVTLRATDPAELEAAVQTGDISGYLVIPARFRADVLRGRRAVVVYGGDADRFLVFKQVLGGLAEAAGTLSAGVEVRRLQAAGQTARQALVAQGPVTLRLRPLFNTRESYGAYLIPAVFMLLLQQTLLIGTGLIYGTDAASGGTRATAGLSRLEQLGRFTGSCLALVALYAVHLAFYLGFCFWLFDVPRYGGALALAAFAVPFLLALVLFAQAIGGFFREREASIQILLFTSIPFLFLAGFAWPLELMPLPVRWLAQLVPVTAGIQGFLRINQMHADFAETGRWWWTLWGLCLLYAWPAWRNWRRVYGTPGA